MSDTQEYGMFKTHLDSHTALASAAEEVLKEEGSELDTPTLASKIAPEKVDDMSESYCRSLLLEGREWIVENSQVEIEERSQETGGNATVYWKLM
ncbi:hypothetical protein [Natrinema sp. H-ect4]|uniref:hypothetical protein n=1 Tax=Natrinema sp. H-ect4 TaxID=3242699 RepID=UPI0035A96F7B